jgi:hypothetical protein
MVPRMVESEPSPSARALDEVRRLAGPSAAIKVVTRLEGGQHATTWRVQLRDPARSVVVRQFPVGDSAGAHERRVLRALDGLGETGPCAARQRPRMPLVRVADAPAQLARRRSGHHSERPGETGSSARRGTRDGALRDGSRGTEHSVLQPAERVWPRRRVSSGLGRPARGGRPVEVGAAARSQNLVASWVPSYAPLGRPDLDEAALRHRHALWTARLPRVRGGRA